MYICDGNAHTKGYRKHLLPRTHTQGVRQLVCLSVVMVDMKMARSGLSGTLVSCNGNYAGENGKYRLSLARNQMSLAIRTTTVAFARLSATSTADYSLCFQPLPKVIPYSSQLVRGVCVLESNGDWTCFSRPMHTLNLYY